jgi:hypothetical protein
MEKVEDIYMRIWCVFMPVTGTVLIPSVQGTTPAYMMAFGSLIFVLLRLRNGDAPKAVVSYFKALGGIVLLWLFLMAASQLWLMLTGRVDFKGVNLTEPDDPKVLFRTTIFTQSLYFFACVFVALYFRYFFREHWMRYIFWGAYFIAVYGIYEWAFYLIFHRSGDFMVNRTFGADQNSASWSQGVNFGGVELLRIKSTLGEPSFFIAVCIPFLFLALDYRIKWLTRLLVFCALFSTSTGCYICVSICLFIKSIWTGRINFRILGLLLLILAFIGGIAVLFPDNFTSMFEDKLSGQNFSGKVRIDGMISVKALLLSFDTGNWLFGLGFGDAYLGIFYGLVVNTGLIGLAVFLYVLLKPIIFLPVAYKSEGLKMALIALSILSAISLSELFIPTTWMFFGLAHRRLALLKLERRSSPEPGYSRLQPAGARV